MYVHRLHNAVSRVVRRQSQSIPALGHISFVGGSASTISVLPSTYRPLSLRPSKIRSLVPVEILSVSLPLSISPPPPVKHAPYCLELAFNLPMAARIKSLHPLSVRRPATPVHGGFVVALDSDPNQSLTGPPIPICTYSSTSHCDTCAPFHPQMQSVHMTLPPRSVHLPLAPRAG